MEGTLVRSGYWRSTLGGIAVVEPEMSIAGGYPCGLSSLERYLLLSGTLNDEQCLKMCPIIWVTTLLLQLKTIFPPFVGLLPGGQTLGHEERWCGFAGSSY